MQETQLLISVGTNDSTYAIHRGSQLTYNVRCSFDRKVSVTSGIGAEVLEKEIVFIKKGDSNFTAEMTINTNNFFDTKAPTPLQARK